MINKEKNLKKAALKSGMDVKTARKYLKSGLLPGEMKRKHNKHSKPTRKDPFKDVEGEINPYLKINPGLEAKTLFEYLKEKYPDRFQDGQLRTLQRKIKRWRAIEGPPKEVFFPQTHYPGALGASDFTHMNSLGITINHEKFNHMLYHFVLTYSNWETANICFSESLESLSEGLQKALWKLGGVPLKHRTDKLSAAVNKDCSRNELTDNYKALLNHYGIKGVHTNPNSGHENGDAEQSHNRLKKEIAQTLMMRGSKNFKSRNDYEEFLNNLMAKRNTGKQKRFFEETKLLKRLPENKIKTQKIFVLKVGKSSTINVLHNTYSVNSRLIGERIEIRANAETLELWYGQKQVDTLPRLRGEAKSAVNYRHIISWLKRKPGAFEEYKYRDDLFPSTTFRIAYDVLKRKYPDTGNKKYIQLLDLAANEIESKVEKALKYLLEKNLEPNYKNAEQILNSNENNTNNIEPNVSAVNLFEYDNILCEGGVK
ncbi:MAG: IS21 family transposase [Candidatus Aenigmarchaeota archaeon]|nr:IS21 family transposase [Candidatus Aenigmarchaeota archaeon]